jgi:hypothetical protein
MANHQKDFLFVLIKSLSKSEKRQFKIFASRLETSSNTKFIELFNILDKSVTDDVMVVVMCGFVGVGGGWGVGGGGLVFFFGFEVSGQWGC